MKKIKAFTLIELLVVVAIIVVLSVIVYVNYSKSQEKSRNAKRSADLDSLVSAIRIYFDEKGTLPPNPDLGACIVGSTNCLQELVSVGYITALPADPLLDYNYDYFNYTGLPPKNPDKKVVVVRAKMEPPKFNPSFPYGNTCSDINGKGVWEDMISDPYDRWCNGFLTE